MTTTEKTNGMRDLPRPRGAVTVVLPTGFSSLSSWTVATVRAALDAHESGDFSSSALLAEAVLRDSAIFSDLQIRAFALASRAGLPFSIDPSRGVDDRRAASIAQDVEDLWWVSFPETETAALQRDAVMLGVAIGRDHGQWVEGEWVPRVRRLRPTGLRWSEIDRSFRYIDGDGVDHLVTPGVDGWILHAPFGADSWMYGAIRAIGIPWIGRINTTRDFLRFCEKHGMPALAIEEPFSASDDVEGTGGAQSSQTQAFYADLRRMPQESLVRLPQGQSKDEPGWKAYWLELKSRGHGAFVDAASELRREVTSVILGRDPGTAAAKVGGDGASFLERVRGEFLSSDAEGLSTTLREQVLKPWIVRNYDAKRPELAPWPRWDTRPPPDLAARASTLKTLGEALGLLSAQGVDVEPVLAEFGLERSQAPVPAASPAPPPAPPAAGATVHQIRRFAAFAKPFNRPRKAA
jgi:phage gp29-like protein